MACAPSCQGATVSGSASMSGRGSAQLFPLSPSAGSRVRVRQSELAPTERRSRLTALTLSLSLRTGRGQTGSDGQRVGFDVGARVRAVVPPLPVRGEQGWGEAVRTRAA